MRRILKSLIVAGIISAALAAAAGADADREARIAYLKKNAIPVRSIDAADVDYADLEPLRGAIGDRRIVMLGETSHGDGATFAAKVRLIKFLHERMGFDVLAFESGFYDVRKAWSALRAGGDPGKAVDSCVDRIWRDSRQTRPLWDYLAAGSKTGRPLELAGFDTQFTGSASSENLLKDLRDYLSRAGLPPAAAGAAERVTNALALILEDPNFIIRGSAFKSLGARDQAAVLAAHGALGQALGALHPPGGPGIVERDFWVQFLKNSAAYMEQSWRVDLESLDQTFMDWAFNRRDRQMGDNVVWLARRAFPDSKIIVWAGTSHVIRHRNVPGDPRAPRISMGDVVAEAMGSEVYGLGFAAYRSRRGAAGTSEPAEAAPAAPNSLEDLLFSAGFEYAWLDFRNPSAGGQWLREPLVCGSLGYKPMAADWSRIMDGVFFIKEMFPSERIER